MPRADKISIPGDDVYGAVEWRCSCGGFFEPYVRSERCWWLRCVECGEQYTHLATPPRKCFPSVGSRPVRNADLGIPEDFKKAVSLIKQIGIDIEEVLNESKT